MLTQLAHTIFAEGEVTGHAHRASGGVLLEDRDVTSTDGPLRIWVNEQTATVTHEEHAAISLGVSPTGRWRIGGVIVADPFSARARRVAD